MVCHLDHITLPNGTRPTSWEEVLPLYDQDVQFANGYAYNIDATKSQATKIIESTHPDIFGDNIERPKNFTAMSFLIDCFNDIEQELLTANFE